MSDYEEEKKASEEQAEDGDGEVYNTANEVILSANEAAFRCYNPIMKGSHIEYVCCGVDEKGPWEGERRFNQFYKLVEKLE